MERFKGKLLVRRTTVNGKPALIFAGIMTPSEPIENYSDRDEMWGVELGVLDVKKLEGTGSGSFSPEDFLEGNGQDRSLWRDKTLT